ncbi:hypothetical protein CH289_11305 [Rhodococcus sp. RS1C4]|uniref:hypothetical protein n=1 Tax=Nocardiaceae TaxID=85025 RepID=UPI00037D442E|nr:MULTISPECIES: hypothetical protein [Rhodococcus]OZC52865.1 hypothetical protein CH289_11305 [Rhodococcus sp. RS1C4]OZC77401.1 hypothetical protein CH282_23125 [Rhodococcus sp. 06-418-1B]OZD62779.1 hypothetical protein CH263_18640 [Rhodococcus sp. 06-1059B-a]OZF05765.1 hypothetical protein CH300_10980 [Rhodococcus sp. 15-1154-1]OZF48575.1 hypothetical protein CH292_16360 [Rhodococcus sp. 14-2470-1a]
MMTMDTQKPLAVGAHVKVRYSSDSSLPRDQWPKESGVVKEDFGEQTASVDRTWARAHRYAVALDDGRLVFVDPEDIEAT